MGHDGARAGVIHVSHEKHIFPYLFVQTKLCSNNMGEYQALIWGLQMATRVGIKDLNFYVGSQLVINQLLEEFRVKKDDPIPHHKHVLQLLDKLELIKLEMFLGVPTKWLMRLQTLLPLWHLGRKENYIANL